MNAMHQYKDGEELLSFVSYMQQTNGIERICRRISMAEHLRRCPFAGSA